MTRREALQSAAQRLIASGASDATLDAQWLLADAVGVPRLTMLADLNCPLAEDEAARFSDMLTRREAGEPLQYVLGTASFMGHAFRVDARALIPRADTEALCEAAISTLPEDGALLDLCTGSGAIAIAVKLARPRARVTATDISEDALNVARENARALRADVRFVRGDLLSAVVGERFDVIACNPPYIPTGDLDALQREVRREPRLALAGGADGLIFYRRIIPEAPGHLPEGGVLLLEVGDDQAAAVADMAAAQFQTINILRDLSGRERIIAAR